MASPGGSWGARVLGKNYTSLYSHFFPGQELTVFGPDPWLMAANRMLSLHLWEHGHTVFVITLENHMGSMAVLGGSSNLG